MASSVQSSAASSPLERLQNLRPPQAKADLKKVQKQEQWAKDGAAIALCISLAGRRQKQAAADVGMLESQLAAQIAGAERPQCERFEEHDTYAAPMQVAKALQKPGVFEVRWTITAKVTA